MNSVLFNNNYGKCSLFKKTESDINDTDYIVTGIKKKSEFTYCSIARNYDNMCGRQAKKYISKLDNN